MWLDGVHYVIVVAGGRNYEGGWGGAVIVLGRRAIVDAPTLLMFAAALGVVLWMRKVPEPVLLLAAGVVGIVLHRSA